LSALRTIFAVLPNLAFLLLALICPPALAQSANPSPATAAGGRMVTQGLARTVTENLFQCPLPLKNFRRSAVGTIKASDGTSITVPAQTAYATGT